jgi:transcriptional regulator with XRE-family HTH domain
MIAEKVVQEVRRLLVEGALSQRKIALRTGVCRGTVCAIASGRRPDYEPRESLEDEEAMVGPAVRCGKCGAMVYLPCRRCKLEDVEARNPRVHWLPRGVDANERLGLDLRPEHRARYEEVLVWRREQAAAMRLLEGEMR